MEGATHLPGDSHKVRGTFLASHTVYQCFRMVRRVGVAVSGSSGHGCFG